MPSSSSLPGCQALLPGGSPVAGSCLALRRQVGSVHVPLLLSPREESGCQLWLVKPLNMGALCGGVWRGLWDPSLWMCLLLVACEEVPAPRAPGGAWGLWL